LRQSANIVVKAKKVQVRIYPLFLFSGQGTAPSFYRPRGGGLQLSCIVLLTSDGMVYSATECMVVLMNLASGGRRGESCARPGATSRVALWKPLVWSSSIRQLEGWASGGLEIAQQQVWRCLVVLASYSAGDGAAVLRMVAQRWGWPHRANGDRGDALHWFDVKASSRAGAG
jgi:hypothetical protein